MCVERIGPQFVLAVRAESGRMAEDFAVVDLESVQAEPFPESGLLHRKLTDPDRKSVV